jgi:hypothetical protein
MGKRLISMGRDGGIIFPIGILVMSRILVENSIA